MKQETSQHLSPALVSDQEMWVVELSMKDIETVSGGPQIINDGVLPP